MTRQRCRRYRCSALLLLLLLLLLLKPSRSSSCSNSPPLNAAGRPATRRRRGRRGGGRRDRVVAHLDRPARRPICRRGQRTVRPVLSAACCGSVVRDQRGGALSCAGRKRCPHGPALPMPLPIRPLRPPREHVAVDGVIGRPRTVHAAVHLNDHILETWRQRLCAYPVDGQVGSGNEWSPWR